MKIRLLLFFLLFSYVAFAQAIQGTVLDEQKKPLPGATVYLDGTTISTLTDADGKYYLVVKEKINSSLVISYLGYNSVFIANPFENNNQNVTLSLKPEALKEVVIVKNGFSRKSMLNIFREYFLGRTVAGKSCKIENEDEISFVYDYDNNLLTASSSVPLLVNNEYLGYKIKFDLYEFSLKFYKKSIKSQDVTQSLFLGTALFSEVINDEKVKLRREKVYQGSSMHFFKNLTNTIWGKDDFLLFRKSFQADPSQFFKIEDNGDLKKVTILVNDLKDVLLAGKKPKFYSVYNVLYKKKDQSQIVFKTDTLYIDNFGNNLNVKDVEYSGVLSTKKMGDLLPMNYKSQADSKTNLK
nr:carboxypeptidase-like regulatory domain-containing protein [uncultured Flavobacterium sp.]